MKNLIIFCIIFIFTSCASRVYDSRKFLSKSASDVPEYKYYYTTYTEGGDELHFYSNKDLPVGLSIESCLQPKK